MPGTPASLARGLLLAILLLLSVTASHARSLQIFQKQEEKLAVAAIPRPNSTALYVGIDQGIFKKEGLAITLKPVTTGQQGLKALLAGEVDAASATATPIAESVVNGEPIAIVATLAETEEADVVIAKKGSGIAGPADLRGKRIGVTRGTGADFFLHVYLIANYVNPAEVRLVDTEPGQIVEALVKDEVEAVCVWSPYKLVLTERLGPDALVLSDPSLSLQTSNLVTKANLVRSNPERIRKLLRGVMRANAFIDKYPEESQTIMAKYVGTASALYKKEWSHYHFTAVLNQSLILNLEDQARWILARNLATPHKLPNFMNYIDAGPLKTVQPEAVGIIGK